MAIDGDDRVFKRKDKDRPQLMWLFLACITVAEAISLVYRCAAQRRQLILNCIMQFMTELIRLRWKFCEQVKGTVRFPYQRM